VRKLLKLLEFLKEILCLCELLQVVWLKLKKGYLVDPVEFREVWGMTIFLDNFTFHTRGLAIGVEATQFILNDEKDLEVMELVPIFFEFFEENLASNSSFEDQFNNAKMSIRFEIVEKFLDVIL